MKKIIAIILILGGVNNLFAQIVTTTYQIGEAFERLPKLKITKQNSPEKKMPQFDVSVLLEEDEASKGLGLPFRFGKSFNINFTLKDGKWQEVSARGTTPYLRRTSRHFRPGMSLCS